MDLGASTFLFFNSFNNTWHKPVVEAGGAVVRATLRCRVSVRIMPRVFYARRNRRNSPSMARFLLASASMPRHFCALQHNSTDTKQLRYSPALQYHLPPPPAYATYAEIQCAGPHLRFGRHGALSLHVGSSKLTTLPTRHTKLAAGHAVCSEENYELPRGSIFPNNKKSPGISSIYPYMGSGAIFIIF